MDGWTIAVVGGAGATVLGGAVIAGVARLQRWRRRPLLSATLVTPSESRNLPQPTALIVVTNDGRTPLYDVVVQFKIPARLSPVTNATARMAEDLHGSLWGVFEVHSERAIGAQASYEIAFVTFTTPKRGRWLFPVSVRSAEGGSLLQTTVPLELG